MIGETPDQKTNSERRPTDGTDDTSRKSAREYPLQQHFDTKMGRSEGIFCTGAYLHARQRRYPVVATAPEKTEHEPSVLLCSAETGAIKGQ